MLLAIAIQAGDHLDGGLDTLYLQEHFGGTPRWRSVTRLVPRLIDSGQDPFTADLPTDHYPEVTRPAPGYRLTWEFLTDIACEYLHRRAALAPNHGRQPQRHPRTIVIGSKARNRHPRTRPSGQEELRIADIPEAAGRTHRGPPPRRPDFEPRRDRWSH